MKSELILRESFENATYHLWLMERLQTGKCLVAKPLNIEMVEYESSVFMLPEPTLSISRMEGIQWFQSAANWLAEQGVRPNTDRIAGELAASKEYLKSLENSQGRILSILETTVRK